MKPCDEINLSSFLIDTRIYMLFDIIDIIGRTIEGHTGPVSQVASVKIFCITVFLFVKMTLRRICVICYFS